MIGAIIGDIVGSRFEFNNHRSKEFEFFTEDCKVTDDSIMTLAIAKSLMETERVIQPSIDGSDYDCEYDTLFERMAITYMQKIGRQYPNCGFGRMFSKWVFSDDPEPYNSFGNGAAMRISPVGFFARTESEARRLSEIVTGTTHNHDEGLKGAEATAVAIFMARRGFTKIEIRNRINSYYYHLDFSIDGIRDTYLFNETCQETVPQAIMAFLESTSFEDAIRTAISVGGDSDTLAAITGAIAEAYYGVPEILRQKALAYLDNELRAIYDEWCNFDKNECTPEKFKVLTKYIGKLEAVDSFDKWFFEQGNDGTTEHPYQMPFLHFNELAELFVKEFYQFFENHPEYQLTSYESIMESHGIAWDAKSMRDADEASLDTQCILALIMGAIRTERFCEGTLLSFFEDGSILKWLRRLKFIDNFNNLVGIEEIYFEIGGFFGGFDKYHIRFNEEGEASLFTTKWFEPSDRKYFSKEEAAHLLDGFKSIQVDYWNSEYIDPFVCDGTQWRLAVKYKDQRATVWEGSNAYPANWNELLSFWGIDYEDEE